MDDDQYIQQAQKRIEEIEAEFQNAKLNKLSAAERKKIGNRKTAM